MIFSPEVSGDSYFTILSLILIVSSLSVYAILSGINCISLSILICTFIMISGCAFFHMPTSYMYVLLGELFAHLSYFNRVLAFFVKRCEYSICGSICVLFVDVNPLSDERCGNVYLDFSPSFWPCKTF